MIHQSFCLSLLYSVAYTWSISLSVLLVYSVAYTWSISLSVLLMYSVAYTWSISLSVLLVYSVAYTWSISLSVLLVYSVAYTWSISLSVLLVYSVAYTWSISLSVLLVYSVAYTWSFNFSVFCCCVSDLHQGVHNSERRCDELCAGQSRGAGGPAESGGERAAWHRRAAALHPGGLPGHSEPCAQPPQGPPQPPRSHQVVAVIQQPVPCSLSQEDRWQGSVMPSLAALCVIQRSAHQGPQLSACCHEPQWPIRVRRFRPGCKAAQTSEEEPTAESGFS